MIGQRKIFIWKGDAAGDSVRKAYLKKEVPALFSPRNEESELKISARTIMSLFQETFPDYKLNIAPRGTEKIEDIFFCHQ